MDCLDSLTRHQFTNPVVKIALLSKLVLIACLAVQGQQAPRPASQTPTSAAETPSAATPSAPTTPIPTQSPLPSPQPQATPSPRPSASPQSTPFTTPALPGPTPTSSNTPAPSSSPSSVTVQSVSPTQSAANPLTLDEALRLANTQASAFQQAGLNEQIAAEDVKQARAAFLPRVTAPLDYIYTSPARGVSADPFQTFSFIAANAIHEYQALVSVAGDLDVSGRLRATLAKNRALLTAARAGTEVARRALAEAVVEAYYGLALAVAGRQAAEGSLLAAEEFQRITSLLLSGGEVAPVDLTRAQLQTTNRRDELERARAGEVVAAGALRVLVGYDFLKPITTSDLALTVPVEDAANQITADTISKRPEFAQFEAERHAAEQEIRAARAERLPQLSYFLNGGFDTDSLRTPPLNEHTGISAAFSLSIPIFDWGASKSRERQARLRAQSAELLRVQAVRGFVEQFYSSRAQLISAIARIRLARLGVDQAESNLRASIARYRSGEAQVIEVTDAQSTLVTQRQALYQSLFDYQIALSRLKQAAGQ